MARGADAVEEGRRLSMSWWRVRAMGRCRRLIEVCRDEISERVREMVGGARVCECARFF